MFATRTFVLSLTMTFLLGALNLNGIGMLAAVLVMCPLLYTTLNIREELQSSRLLRTHRRS